MSRTHFELLQLTPRFRLDDADLQDRLRRFQAAVHPDRFAGAGDAERRMALQLSSAGNEARRVLTAPTLRAAYLCSLHGCDVAGERDTKMDPAFLMAQMEWHEAIDECRASGDPDRLRGLAQRLDGSVSRLRDAVAEALDDREDWAGAAVLVRQLMFFDKLQLELQKGQRPGGAGF